MENFGSLGSLVLVYDSESRAADLIFDTKLSRQRFDQSRLARTHLPLKDPNLLLSCRGNYLTRGKTYVL